MIKIDQGEGLLPMAGEAAAGGVIVCEILLAIRIPETGHNVIEIKLIKSFCYVFSLYFFRTYHGKSGQLRSTNEKQKGKHTMGKLNTSFSGGTVTAID
jgi:hypothetical protein